MSFFRQSSPPGRGGQEGARAITTLGDTESDFAPSVIATDISRRRVCTHTHHRSCKLSGTFFHHHVPPPLRTSRKRPPFGHDFSTQSMLCVDRWPEKTRLVSKELRHVTGAGALLNGKTGRNVLRCSQKSLFHCNRHLPCLSNPVAVLEKPERLSLVARGLFSRNFLETQATSFRTRSLASPCLCAGLIQVHRRGGGGGRRAQKRTKSRGG